MTQSATPASEAKPSAEDMLADAQEELHRLLNEAKSVILGTVSSQGDPEASYAPVVRDSLGRFYVYVSALSKHTSNLRSGRKASVLVIEDEKTASELFARKRATFTCSTEVIARDSGEFNKRIEQMERELGDVMQMLKNMMDFSLVRLIPEDGRLVVGFGQAYRITGDDLNALSHLGGGGKGHKLKSDG